MIVLALWLQLSAVDSTYSSATVKALVNDAAARNRKMPVSVRRYVAAVETEVAIGIRQSKGIEAPVSLEQLESEARWTRPGEFEEHVVGDRLQASGPQLTALMFTRQSLLVPHLYGNRIQLLFGADSGIRRVDRARPGRQVSAIHPLSDDKDRIYRFSGGDTVVTMRVDSRVIPVVRIVVTPRRDVPPRTVVFAGEMFLDVTRAQLVKMRGRFFATGPSRRLLERALTSSLESALYVDLDNREVDRQVWLPATQRFEAQILFRISTDTRSIFRTISTFRDYRVDLDSMQAGAPTDTLEARVHRLTMAGGDSLGRSSHWVLTLGSATANAHAEDFDDFAPDAWRPTGTPRLDVRATRLADLVHLNRIEGWYTGVAAEFRARDAAPGLKALSNVGWAWQEATLRGRTSLVWDGGRSRFDLHAGRTIDITNDFRAPLDSGSTLGALFGVDDYDYVSRHLFGTSWRTEWGRSRWAVTDLMLERVKDDQVTARMMQSPLGIGSAFRANRGASQGTYTRSIVSIDLNRRVTLGLIQPGVGAAIVWQAGAGDLEYQRLEGRGIARWHGEHTTLALRADAGAVWGTRIPAQQLFELGAGQNLLGYSYKEFTGNQAVVLRGLAMRALPLLRGLWKLSPRILLPAPAPAIAVSGQTGWVRLRGSPAVQAMRDLLPTSSDVPGATFCDSMTSVQNIVPRPTCGWRTSAGVGVRLFGGAIGIDYTHPVDRRSRWRLQLRVGQIL